MSSSTQLMIPVDFNARTKAGDVRVHTRHLPLDARVGDEFVAYDAEDPELKVIARVTFLDADRGVAHLDLDWDCPIVEGQRMSILWYSPGSSTRWSGEVSGSRKFSIVHAGRFGYSSANERKPTSV